MSNDEIEIVIVEDVPSDAELLVRVFKKQNMLNKIILLRDGEEALNYFFNGDFVTTTQTKLRLVLLDIKLPKVNGIEVLRRMKTDDRTKDIPVVVLTSSQEDRDLKDAHDAGVDDYVTKPIGFEDFVKITSRLGMCWLLVNKEPQGNSADVKMENKKNKMDFNLWK